MQKAPAVKHDADIHFMGGFFIRSYCGLRPQPITPRFLRKMRRGFGKTLYSDAGPRQTLPPKVVT
jgi:hypothetical protein